MSIFAYERKLDRKLLASKACKSRLRIGEEKRPVLTTASSTTSEKGCLHSVQRGFRRYCYDRLWRARETFMVDISSRAQSHRWEKGNIRKCFGANVCMPYFNWYWASCLRTQCAPSLQVIQSWSSNGPHSMRFAFARNYSSENRVFSG